MSAVIDARHLSKWFGEVVAINNLDLVIEPGVTGLLGPNGAGKSTFIKLALGLYAPSRGSITVYGEPPRNNPRVLRRVGYCPETDKFYEAMSGYEFVYTLNRLWGMVRRDARRTAEATLERVNMSARMHDPVHTYSKGMRQRTKLAQALATDPAFLLLDEPMAGLDPKGREEMFALIHSLGEEGRSVVVSSHILHEIERATDRVVLIYHGAVLAHGHIREIRALIDEHPHAITIRCTAPRALASAFVTHPATISTEFTGGAVVVRTRDPNAVYDHVNAMVAEGRLALDSLTCADDNLQSVFDYLVR
ncbi:MAG: ABC transporter ATP-binding protein [Candidatus Hydrogenedentota bacterium]